MVDEPAPLLDKPVRQIVGHTAHARVARGETRAAEVLDQVAHTKRERARIQGEINTLTAQKKLSGIIIGLMPVAFVLMMLVISFDYMSALFTDPLGRFLLVVAIVLDVIGILIIKRIVSVDI